MSLWETFPVPLSQNKESKAETNSGGLISQKQILPSQRTSAICLKIWSLPSALWNEKSFGVVCKVRLHSVHLSNKEGFIKFLLLFICP